MDIFVTEESTVLQFLLKYPKLYAKFTFFLNIRSPRSGMVT